MSARGGDSSIRRDETWPSLRYEDWKDTYATLHLWTQVVGKLRLAHSAVSNHWWHIALYLTSRGLTTSPIPYEGRTYQVDFDFIDHRLNFATTDGEVRTLPLRPQSVAAFYREVMSTLSGLDIEVDYSTMPQEIPDAIPFEQDTTHASYDPEAARRCWQVLAQTDCVCKAFNSRFLGKVSPVHFFWGSFDMAYTRFSGRNAPEHPGGGLLPTWVTREAYSHEVSSCGFWPGNAAFEACFYAYAYPEPAGYSEAAVLPAEAFYSADLHEFLLPYEAVRRSQNPEETLLSFFQSTYEAAANHGGWDRTLLERQPGDPLYR